jgi:hypothetical protein
LRSLRLAIRTLLLPLGRLAIRLPRGRLTVRLAIRLPRGRPAVRLAIRLAIRLPRGRLTVRLAIRLPRGRPAVRRAHPSVGQLVLKHWLLAFAEDTWKPAQRPKDEDEEDHHAPTRRPHPISYNNPPGKSNVMRGPPGRALPVGLPLDRLPDRCLLLWVLGPVVGFRRLHRPILRLGTPARAHHLRLRFTRHFQRPPPPRKRKLEPISRFSARLATGLRRASDESRYSPHLPRSRF